VDKTSQTDHIKIEEVQLEKQKLMRVASVDLPPVRAMTRDGTSRIPAVDMDF